MSTPASPPGPRIDLRGAVDLSGLARRPAPAAAPPAAPGGAPAGPAAPAGPDADAGAGLRVVMDVTDASFPALVQLSAQVPVVVDLWATWCGPCKQLSPVLERLAEEFEGRFLLAKVDVDANPQTAAAFQVQSIPSVVAILRGQPVPLFQGAYPEPQVRQVLEELLRVAEANGVTGRVPADGAQAPAVEDEEPPLPPLHQEAYDAIERDDLDGAADAYRRALAESPADDLARAGLAQVELMRRTRGADLDAARAAAAAAPGDVDAQLLVADLDVLGGHVEDAISRLVDLVRVTAGDERERVRQHLLGLFEVVGAGDPRVAAGRRALAGALF
ncbi:tetratricopeptide repeat protein [Quadrisphaera sp. DSM 44207]|uniref:tetratricopeptide repeat protein n=1 Tax=Quadrisphaera sp. DSM 44207 TaxID=1881057 RepID=UPI00088653C9|nr:tetratricopeptide repeat protein [Quadrisphaera sp. DSM 44207]SDQ74022.1 putative thioredoxin [Quadrisphaera sp. DSM 44207]